MFSLIFTGTDAVGNSIEELAENREQVDFKVIYNKQKYDVSFPIDDSVSKLKTHIQELTGELSLFSHFCLYLFCYLTLRLSSESYLM